MPDEILSVKLTRKEVDQIIDMINNVTFQGKHAQDVLDVLEALSSAAPYKQLDE